MTEQTATDWIRLPWGADTELQILVHERVAQRIQAKKYSREDLYYVSHVNLSAVKGSLDVTDVELEKLRVLCQSWDIELKPARITSHRKIIGPIIVAVKKLFFPLVRMLLKDLIQQQRSFNAAALALIAEIAARKKN